MLEEILAHIHNWFISDWEYDHYSIADGKIDLPFLTPNQYYRIIGSLFNDGVYKYGAETELVDEEFDGEIWALAIPRSFLELAEEIEEWQAKNGTAAASPFVSESFGGYSYSKASSANGKNGGSASWITAFASRLNRWRKI